MLAYVDRAAVLQNLGLVRQARGDLEGAHAAWSEALPKSTAAARTELLHNLGALALQRGDAAEAWRLLEAEAARPDTRPQTIYVAAKAAHALGLEPQARALIARLRAMGWDGGPGDEIRR
jgi:Tfp pilus assembly protein PilF